MQALDFNHLRLQFKTLHAHLSQYAERQQFLRLIENCPESNTLYGGDQMPVDRHHYLDLIEERITQLDHICRNLKSQSYEILG